MRLFFMAVFIGLSLLYAQTRPEDEWQGAIEIGATRLDINLHFKAPNQATIDIPQQGATDLALQKVTISAKKVYFELPAGPGLAVFDGVVSNGEIRGSFTQGVAVGSFYLHPMRIKNPASSSFFNSKDVTVPNGAIQLAGTLLTPRDRSSYPAVVLVSGSGPQNRDEEILGFKIFKIIAESLATQGIAVLRYNDRGFAPSTGDFKSATTADFATDALAAVKFLRKKLKGHTTRVGILGHSEGAVIATLLAGQHKPIDFIVLMGGPAIKGDALLKAQSAALIRATHGNDQKIVNEHHLQNEIFKTIRNDSGWGGLKQQIAAAIHREIDGLSKKNRAAIPDVDAYVQAQVAGQMAAVRSPWMKWFINYDPAIDMRNIHIPVLALFGGKDLQVPFLINLNKMKGVFIQNNNTFFTPVVFVDANHLFQKANSGSVDEYANLKKNFVKGFLPRIGQWILHLPR